MAGSWMGQPQWRQADPHAKRYSDTPFDRAFVRLSDGNAQIVTKQYWTATILPAGTEPLEKPIS